MLLCHWVSSSRHFEGSREVENTVESWNSWALKLGIWWFVTTHCNTIVSTFCNWFWLLRWDQVLATRLPTLLLLCRSPSAQSGFVLYSKSGWLLVCLWNLTLHQSRIIFCFKKVLVYYYNKPSLILYFLRLFYISVLVFYKLRTKRVFHIEKWFCYLWFLVCMVLSVAGHYEHWDCTVVRK